MKIEYSAIDLFQKDLKSLLKKYRTLEEDLKTAKCNAIELCHLRGVNNKSIFRIKGVGTETIQIYKIKKFACKSLKGCGVKSGIRVIYAFYPAIHKVEFIEIYLKDDKKNRNEDFSRIKGYLKIHESSPIV
jgi:hypothetical protein